jgi:hypothetical protein
VDEATSTAQTLEAPPDGRALGIWSLAITSNGERDPRFGGLLAVDCTAIPWHPGWPYPAAHGFVGVGRDAPQALLQALTPLVAHLSAVGAKAFAVDEATGAKAIAAERLVLLGLVNEALACAGPVARQMAEAQRRARESDEPG